MISTTSFTSLRNKITLIPLKDPMFISLMKEFRNLLKSSIGPNGNFKFLISGGGYVQLSSSSSQIVEYYDQFSSPIIQCIVQIMKGQMDYGLYCGIIICSCLEHFLNLQCSERITSKHNILIVKSIINYCNQVFDMDALKIRLNFTSVTDFIPVVTTILKSKCKELVMRDSTIHELSFQIIKAFLSSFNDQSMMLGKISVQIFKGDEKFKFYPGVIYQLVDNDAWISKLIAQKFYHKSGIKTLLFTVALDNDDSLKIDFEVSDNNLLSHVLLILDEAIRLGVNVVACQKVIHCDISLFLRRKSVIVLERMGTEIACNFQQLTDSFPISDLGKLSLINLPSMIGVVDEVNCIEIATKHYLLIERQAASVTTLLLQIPCLSGSQQMKTLVEQALKTLEALIKYPYVCPGAGCFEVCLFMNIQAIDKENKLNKQLQWLLNIFIEASGNSMPVWVDTVYKHLWSTEDQSKCNCRLLSRDVIVQSDGLFQLLSFNNDSFDFSFDFSDNPGQITELSESCIVDSFILKKNSIVTSFESCINLLGIGSLVCVKKM